jgi:hypothetical protein
MHQFRIGRLGHRGFLVCRMTAIFAKTCRLISLARTHQLITRVLTLYCSEISVVNCCRMQYQGHEAVCTELRKLPTLGLIRNRKDHRIGEISTKHSFDLKDIVELTGRGRQHIERLGEYGENK